MKAEFISSLVLFSLMDSISAAPASDPKARQLSGLPDLGGGGTGTIPSLGGGGSGIIPGLGGSGSSSPGLGGILPTGTTPDLGGSLPTGLIPGLGKRQLSIPGLGGSGTGTIPGLGGSGSGTIPGLGGSGSGTIPGLGGSGSGTIPGLGGSGSSPGLGGILPTGTSPDLGGSLPTGLIPGLGKRQLSIPGLGGSSSGTIPGLGGSGSSGIIPGLGGSGSGSSPDLGGLLPTGTSPDLGGSLPTGLIPGLGKRQFSIPGLGSGSFPTSIPSSGGLGSFGGSSSGSGSSSSTANDVVNKAGCTSLTVIFARGTGESGNVGTVAGPPLFSALESKLGKTITKQGVDYPASAMGNANMGADGGPTMLKLVQQAKSQCPSSKIIISGYSQGGSVTHNAAKQSGFPTSDIAGVVIFGDPANGSAVGSIPSSKLKEFCAQGDDVCNGSGTFAITPAHLTYGNNASAAADFIVSVAQL